MFGPTHWTHAAAPVPTGWPFGLLRHEVPAAQQLAGGVPPEQSTASGAGGSMPCAVHVTSAIVPGWNGFGGDVGAVPTHTVELGTHCATQNAFAPLVWHKPTF